MKVAIFVMVRMDYLPENFWAILLSERFFCIILLSSLQMSRAPFRHSFRSIMRNIDYFDNRRKYIACFIVGAL